MIIIVDNYDSFVETLARYVREAGHATRTIKNDVLTTDEIASLSPEAIILSPGPYTPREAGVCVALPSALPHTPILGVCLGHLAIAEAYGGKTRRTQTALHGQASPIEHNERGIFRGLPNPFEAGRYHALAADISGTVLHETAVADDGTLMAFEHPERPHFGVQFHPESVLTPCGRALLGNFLEHVG
ncbi:MAG: aminodeoxychorismate/anthranilate synthase component II [Pseudomonadota bacterium]